MLYSVEALEQYMKDVGISKKIADPILINVHKSSLDGWLTSEALHDSVNNGCIAHGFVLAHKANPDLYAPERVKTAQ